MLSQTPKEGQFSAAIGNELPKKLSIQCLPFSVPLAPKNFPQKLPSSFDNVIISGPRVFFKGLEKKISRAEIEELFSEYGEIHYLRFPFNQPRQRNLGYGYVIFNDPKVADHLLQDVKQVNIGEKHIDLILFSDKENKKSKKVKNTLSTIKTHIREQTPEKADFQPKHASGFEGLNRKRGRDPTNPAYVIYWDLHSVKPCHRLYFSPANPGCSHLDHREEDLEFRVPHYRDLASRDL